MLFRGINRLSILILFEFVSNCCLQYNNFPDSPCPSVFLYKYDGQEWYGEIKIPIKSMSPRGLSLMEVTLMLRIAQNGQLRRANISLITDSNDVNNWLKFRVTFPQRYPLPKLVEISFGNRIVCRNSQAISKPNNIFRPIKVNYFVKTAVQKPTISQSSKSIKVPQLNGHQNQSHQVRTMFSNAACGVTKIKLEFRSLVFGGEIIQRGEWPWLVAIYLAEAFGVSFACGGNLISTRAVLTAAHCVKSSNKVYLPREVLLYFGHYNRLDWTESDSIRSRAVQIFIHPDYRKHKQMKDADLAIIITEEIIKFNEFIQPVCVTSEGQESESNGFIVGWGRDSLDRIASTHPRKIGLPIIEVDRCIEESPSIASALSNRTFCAGTLDGNGPCHGDSGSGLMVHRNDRWIIRGIVSAGLSDVNNGMCKLTDFIIFTDVEKFLPWIYARMQ